MKTLLLFFMFGFLLAAEPVSAQFNRYLIQCKHKQGTPFSLQRPQEFLSPRAIQRRIRYNIPIDSSDLPVPAAFIDSIRNVGNVTILNVSKWLNQISIETSDPTALVRIGQLSFVEQTVPIAARPSPGSVNQKNNEPLLPITTPSNTARITGESLNYGVSGNQIRIHQGTFLHNHGFRGQPIHVAVIDAGFRNYNNIPTFDSVRNTNRLLSTWDFVMNESSVSEDDTHGMYCFSIMAANMPGSFVGSAPEASYHLFRSEDVRSEYPIEEHNFACAAERADSAGVDVCSISLGYSTFDNPLFHHTYADMDGNTTISAKATDLAAAKGMLMAVAAGNEGGNSWRFVISPGDADSALTVGAVDTLGNTASFSSYGPSSDGQIKPTLASVGRNTVVANAFSGLPQFGSGTSFACPNMAGLAACLWQAFPEVNNMDLIQTLTESSTRFNNPDDRQGYGIPDLKKAFVLLQKKKAQVAATFLNCATNIVCKIKTDSGTIVRIERKYPNESGFSTIKTFTETQPFALHTYAYTDNLIGTTQSSVQYRYRVQIGSDTTYLLDSSAVSFTIPCDRVIPSADGVSLYPNPASSTLQVSVASVSNAQVVIRIIDATGKAVLEKTGNQPAGTQLHSLSVEQLARGLYVVQVFLNNKRLEPVPFVK